MFSDGAGRATGWVQTQRRGMGGQGGIEWENEKIRGSGARRHMTETLFARGDRGNDGQDTTQNLKSTVRIKKLCGLLWSQGIQLMAQ
jgi:hypothetical protein